MPKICFKLVIQSNLKNLGIDAYNLETLTEYQSVWKKMINDDCKTFKEKKINQAS